MNAPAHTNMTKPAALASRALALLGGSWSSGAFARRVRRPAARTPATGVSGVFTSGYTKPRAGRERRGADVVSFNGFRFIRKPMTEKERAALLEAVTTLTP